MMTQGMALLVMEWSEKPESLREGTTCSLVPFPLCPPGWDVPARAPQARGLQRQSQGSRNLCTALLGMSAPRQCQWDVAGEAQGEDGAISHSPSETGHSFPLPQTGWEQHCWLQHGWAWLLSCHGAPWTNHILAFCLSPLFVKWTQILHKGVVKPN